MPNLWKVIKCGGQIVPNLWKVIKCGGQIMPNLWKVIKCVVPCGLCMRSSKSTIQAQSIIREHLMLSQNSTCIQMACYDYCWLCSIRVIPIRGIFFTYLIQPKSHSIASSSSTWFSSQTHVLFFPLGLQIIQEFSLLIQETLNPIPSLLLLLPLGSVHNSCTLLSPSQTNFPVF